MPGYNPCFMCQSHFGHDYDPNHPACKTCDYAVAVRKRDMSKESIGKGRAETPRHVTHESTLYKCHTCPTCKNVVDEYETFGGQRVHVQVQHCKFCGQALLWGGEEGGATDATTP